MTGTLVDDLAEVLKRHLGEYPTDFVVVVNRKGMCQTFGAFASTDKMNDLLKQAVAHAEKSRAQGLRRKIEI
jgi:hypothetical protein